MNELQIYSTEDPTDLQGYRTILAAPPHPPYRQFIPARVMVWDSTNLR